MIPSATDSIAALQSKKSAFEHNYEEKKNQLLTVMEYCLPE